MENNLKNRKGFQSAMQAILDRSKPVDTSVTVETLPAAPKPLEPEWPVLREEALYGLAGDFIRKYEGRTEADPAAMLIQFLTIYGVSIGRHAHCQIGDDRHYGNLFCCIVGSSSNGRKGVSLSHVIRIFEEVDPEFCNHCITSSVISGEGLLWRLRERDEGDEDGGGTGDKQLLIIEREFSRLLKNASRQQSTVSEMLRCLFEQGDYDHNTRQNQFKVRGAHVGMIAQTTPKELKRELNPSDLTNGFTNRILWCMSRRNGFQPFGGETSKIDLTCECLQLRDSIEYAKKPLVFDKESFDDDAAATFETFYGLFGISGGEELSREATQRGPLMVWKISMLYALLDKSPVIRLAHLHAALAVWQYVEDSAKFIWGGAVGDSDAERILQELKKTPTGLSKTDIRNLFSGHKTAGEIDYVLNLLVGGGLAFMKKESTSGRSVEKWFCTQMHCAKSAKSAIR